LGGELDTVKWDVTPRSSAGALLHDFADFTFTRIISGSAIWESYSEKINENTQYLADKVTYDALRNTYNSKLA